MPTCWQCSTTKPIEEFYREQDKRKPKRGDNLCATCWAGDLEAVAERNDVEALAQLVKSRALSKFYVLGNIRWDQVRYQFDNYTWSENLAYKIPEWLAYSWLIEPAVYLAVMGLAQVKQGDWAAMCFYYETEGPRRRPNRQRQMAEIQAGNQDEWYRYVRQATRVEVEKHLTGGRNLDWHRQHREDEFFEPLTSDDPLAIVQERTLIHIGSRASAKRHRWHWPPGMRTRWIDDMGRSGYEMLAWDPYTDAAGSQLYARWMTRTCSGRELVELVRYTDDEVNQVYRKENAVRSLWSKEAHARARREAMPVLGTAIPLDAAQDVIDDDDKDAEAEALRDVAEMMHRVVECATAQGWGKAEWSILRAGYGDAETLAHELGLRNAKAVTDRKYQLRRKLKKQFPDDFTIIEKVILYNK